MAAYSLVTHGMAGLVRTFSNARQSMREQTTMRLRYLGELLTGRMQRRMFGKRGSIPEEQLGVVTGRLRQSIGYVVDESAGNWELRVGPQRVVYAAIHEFGGDFIPPRPYAAPTLEESREDIIQQLGDGIVISLQVGGDQAWMVD